jgi:hypothetical protein
MRSRRPALAAVALALLATGLACGSGDDDTSGRGGKTTTSIKCDEKTMISAANAGEDVQGCVPGAG